MPVTAMLLLRLRETIGDEATNDLVAWIDEGTHWQPELAAVRDELTRLREEQTRLREDLVQGLAALRVDLASQRSDLMKWMFIFWAGTIVPLAGLMVALVKLTSG